MRITVTAGYGKSLHAIALIRQLAAQGHEVVLGLEVRALTAARLRFYLRRLGWRKLWSKARAKLLPGASRSSHADEVTPMRDYLRAQRITSRTVSQACRRVGARHVRVASLNIPRSCVALRGSRPDLVVYAGGGILRREFIEIPRLGVLNAHGGPLPAFRGMNVAEWALLHGVRPTVTVHYIDTGVDTGPILLQKSLPTDAWSSIARGRGIATRVGVEALLKAVQRIADGKAMAQPQRVAAGRQYFVMAEPLLEVLECWLAQKRTPVVNADDFAFPTGATDSVPRATESIS